MGGPCLVVHLQSFSKSFKNVSTGITLKRRFPRDMGLNYKGLQCQTRPTQSGAILMINPLSSTHTHTFCWNGKHLVGSSVYLEFHLRLNSCWELCTESAYLFRSTARVSQYHVSEDGLNQACVWPQEEIFKSHKPSLIRKCESRTAAVSKR